MSPYTFPPFYRSKDEVMQLRPFEQLTDTQHQAFETSLVVEFRSGEENSAPYLYVTVDKNGDSLPFHVLFQPGGLGEYIPQEIPNDPIHRLQVLHPTRPFQRWIEHAVHTRNTACFDELLRTLAIDEVQAAYEKERYAWAILKWGKPETSGVAFRYRKALYIEPTEWELAASKQFALFCSLIKP